LSAHTDGPWTYDGGVNFPCIRGPYGDPIIYGGHDGELRCEDADGRLIAAAPDLLDLLTRALACSNFPTASSGIVDLVIDADLQNKIRAAISKATGGA